MFKLKTLSFSLALLASVFVMFSCGDDEVDEPETCDSTGITYDNFIGDLITGNCATSGCHEQNTTATFEMYNFETTSEVVAVGRIIGAINHEAGFVPMPRDADKLSDCNIEKIEMWIADGAPE